MRSRFQFNVVSKWERNTTCFLSVSGSGVSHRQIILRKDLISSHTLVC